MRNHCQRKPGIICAAACVAWLFASSQTGAAEPGNIPAKRTVLPNGIVLPSPWPPRDRDPASAEPMPVPYLSAPPNVIPIDVGRQLLVDDFLIESTDLARTFHQPEKYAGNPVVRPQTPAELEATDWTGPPFEGVCYLGHGGVFFDPAERRFKMFYTAGWRGGLAVATSDDLFRWDRPEMHLAGGNLLLPAGRRWAGGDNCVWLDLAAKKPDERLKLLVDRGPRGIHTLHTSADGRIWSQGEATTTADDYCSFYFDPFRGVWVYSIKRTGPRGRCRYYAENADFLAGTNWDEAVYWVGADRLDPPHPEIGDAPQLYSLNAVAYESLMLGMFYLHKGPSNKICEEGKFPKLTELSLGYSRDGFHWHRPDRRAFIAATRKEGDWDRGYLHGTAGLCVIVGDELWFPYTGFSGQSPTGMRGMYCGASIGLARLRRDGFASLDAAATGGVLTTRPLTFRGKHLFVNVDCPQGALRVEVLDRQGKALEPFSADRCQPISADRTKQPVRWQGSADLSAVAGQAVRLRFHLTSGRLYSFWVSPDENGASGGYLAAGGPGYAGVVDAAGAATP